MQIKKLLAENSNLTRKIGLYKQAGIQAILSLEEEPLGGMFFDGFGDDQKLPSDFLCAYPLTKVSVANVVDLSERVMLGPQPGFNLKNSILHNVWPAAERMRLAKPLIKPDTRQIGFGQKV